MYHVPLALQCVYIYPVRNEVKLGIRWKGVRFLEEGRDGRLPGLLYADDLVLCGESREDLRAMLGRFVEVSGRRRLKVKTGMSKVMLLNGEERLECEVTVDGV